MFSCTVARVHSCRGSAFYHAQSFLVATKITTMAVRVYLTRKPPQSESVPRWRQVPAAGSPLLLWTGLMRCVAADFIQLTL